MNVRNLEVSPLITFPCKNNWKTNIEYIEGYSGFVIGPARPEEKKIEPGPERGPKTG